jgi:hypothetical protein
MHGHGLELLPEDPLPELPPELDIIPELPPELPPPLDEPDELLSRDPEPPHPLWATIATASAYPIIREIPERSLADIV